MKKIKETIIVEGRDDTAAIKRSVEGITIETHGYGIRPETWDTIAKAARTTGIIVFTDPDHAGDQIRKRILDRFPQAKQAFLQQEEATSQGDIGIENAAPEAILKALEKARATQTQTQPEFTADDMFRWGLAGCSGAAQKRTRLGKILGIGFANSKTFLQRLNGFGITRDEIEEAIEKL